MSLRAKKSKVILYLLIVAGYLFHWGESDLAIYPGQFTKSLVNNVWLVAFVVGLNAIFFEVILPASTSPRRSRLTIVLLLLSSLIVHIMVSSAAIFWWQKLGAAIQIYEPFRPFKGWGASFANNFRFILFTFIGFAVVKLFFDYMQLRFEGQQLRLEKKQGELVFLKSQINPHFLFNTLNNIYSLSQYQPQLVSESILRLSKILRYTLYETDSALITIEKEIKIVNDYIDLEKLRYDQTVPIDFTFEIDDHSQMIPPLLLLPLIENAFKHGISQSRGNRFLHVTLSVIQNQLSFLVENSTPACSPHQPITENIGLTNIRRRLNLLYREFNLVTRQDGWKFTAALTINLSSDV